MSKRKPKATIFIPTWFGERYIGDLLTQVFSQKVPYEFEVLIYDSSSTDRTQEIIIQHAEKHENLRYKFIEKDDFGHGKTRQAAALDAKGDYIVYVSQDATPAHDRWLYEMIIPMEMNDRVMAVLGKQDPRPNAFPLLKYEIIEVFRGFGPSVGTTLYYKDNFITSQSVYDFVAFYSDVNSATRTRLLKEEIPYRDVPYSEDQLFGREIIDAGYVKAYAARGNVIHSNEMKLREYKKRMFDETIGLRKVGIPIAKPSFKTVTKLIVKGVAKNWINTARDGDYSWKRKIYWFVVNPLFHIEKWRGVRLACSQNLDNGNATDKYSLEAHRHKKNRN